MATDADLDMADLASLDAPASSSATAARFHPKVRGKAKAKVKTKTEPKPKSEPEGEPHAAGGGVDTTEMDMVGAGEAADETDLEGEDFVVREIDVYFTPEPFDKDTKLYIAQYPLRPCWRPYELGEVCREVRVRPESSMVEVDLEIDTESDNYDPEVSASLSLTKQTLSSSEAAADVAGYAVGVLRGGLVHLNHLDAVLQLRPSMSHLISGASRTTRQPLQEVETNGLTVPSVKGDDSESEPWISLTYEPAGSDVASKYYADMIANEGRPMDFTMNTQDYAMSLCPGGPAGSKHINRCEVLREMLSLPLEVRLKKWFTEVSQVNRFDALMHLAPACSEEDLLKILPAYADLVRGLWVCKSSLLYYDDGHASKRDKILLGFTKGESIPVKYVDRLIRDERTRNMILNPLGKRREKLEDYKFIVPADSSFIRRYSHIVKEQENACLEVIGSYPDAAKCSCVRFPSASKVNPCFQDLGRLIHFENGEWFSGGTCNKVLPYKKGEYSGKYMEHVMRGIELEGFNKDITAVSTSRDVVKLKLLDTWSISSMRPDGHAGPCRMFHPFAQGSNKDCSSVQNDCLHWRLPGPIDATPGMIWSLSWF